MEPHELAMAALHQQVAQSAGHRDPTKIAALSPKMTGSDIEAPISNNRIVHSEINAHELLQKNPPGSDRINSNMGEASGYQNNAYALPETLSENNSQSTTDSRDVATPNSTSEGFSSQSTNPDPMSQLSQLSVLAAAQPPLTNTSSTIARPNLTISPTAGQKRTADGQIKVAISKLPISPRVRGHSRNASAVSNISTSSSRIGDISSELRTRLSYAMVKVNNGWQSNSIDEVESLASQAGSPTSSTSTLQARRSYITSPRTAIASIQRKSISEPSSAIHGLTADFDLYSATGQPSRTYESFWRDHSVSNNPSNRYPPHQTVNYPSSRSLAPPADIRPTPSSRRSGTPKFSKPPTIPSQNSNSSLRSSTPRTPNRDPRDNAVIQTPSQKTIQEQDAIETLLFMRSPGNSGNMAYAFPSRSQASPQQSPLRTEFFTQSRTGPGKKVGFDVTTTSEDGGAEYRRNHRSGATVRLDNKSREAAIDRMLEEMDDSSSDDEPVVLNYPIPRRSVVAGRSRFKEPA